MLEIRKKAREFCVLNDRTKENLYPSVKNNIITDEFWNINNPNISESESVKTWFFSDCFRYIKKEILKKLDIF